MKNSMLESGRIAKEHVIRKLNERNYTVTENRKYLSVGSPNGKMFTIKVTSLYKPNAWLVPVPEKADTYFVLVYRPVDGKPPAFFIFNPDEMRQEKVIHEKSKKRPNDEYKNPELEKMGLGFKQVYPYEDKWSSLPK